MEDRDPPYTVSEVKERYGEPSSIIKHEYSTELAYTNLGLSFTCYSLEPSSKISELVAVPPSNLRTSKGIMLNRSTMQEAHDIYGEETWYASDLYPDYWFCKFDHAITFAITRDKSVPKYPLDKEWALKQKISRIELPYFDLLRNDYVRPDPIIILADNNLPKIPSDSIDAFLDRVMVKKIDLDLDAHLDPDWHPLWDNFANRPYEDQFSRMTTKGWEENWRKFKDKIIAEAKANNLDTESLNTILDTSHSNTKKRSSERRIMEAKIPVGAFLATKGAEKIWIVIFKWEYIGSDPENNKFEESSFGHIEILAFRVSDCECVDGSRCT
jgi:hypothetical protein